MIESRNKRALLLVGAGASIDFGAPSTCGLTEKLRLAIAVDRLMQDFGADRAFAEIEHALQLYYQGGAGAVTFEHIYHCAHELLYTFPPSSGAVDDYRPALIPFLERKFEASERALRALIGRMAELVFAEISDASAFPRTDIAPLREFLDEIRSTHIARIYTTNYDDFLLQAAPDLFTGFDPTPCSAPKRFDGEAFWAAKDRDCVFHLHGSAHLSFAHGPIDAELGELFWYDDREDARRHASYYGSADRRMDGSQVERAAIVTGLDKLSRLQRRPLSYFYSSLAEDAMRADVIVVIGYGFGDLHLNNWLKEARARTKRPPVLLIDWWEKGFVSHAAYNQSDRKLIEIWHGLRTDIGYEPHRNVLDLDGWVLDRDRTCAVWDEGFGAILVAPEALRTALVGLTEPRGTS